MNGIVKETKKSGLILAVLLSSALLVILVVIARLSYSPRQNYSSPTPARTAEEIEKERKRIASQMAEADASAKAFSRGKRVKLKIPDACPGIDTDGEIIRSTEAYILNVTFYKSRPSDYQVDKTCRTYLGRAIKQVKDMDIGVSAWYRFKKSADPNDDEMVHPYPNFGYLAFDAKTGAIAVHDMLPKH